MKQSCYNIGRFVKGNSMIKEIAVSNGYPKLLADNILEEHFMLRIKDVSTFRNKNYET